MTTEGIEAVFLETHNWGKAAKFFQALGFELEFSTDHSSGQLRNGDGPYVFIAEVPEDREPRRPDRAEGGRRRRVPSRSCHRGGHPVRGHPLRDQGDDRPRPRRAPVEPPGSSQRLTGTKRSGTGQGRDNAMADEQTAAPDSTAVRVALWRAMHVQVDPPPHVLEDEIGLQLAAPDDGWRDRPDMDPPAPAGSGRPSWPGPASSRTWSPSRPATASPSTSSWAPAWTPSPSAGRRSPPASRVFEVDQPGPQAWKRQRLIELGFGIPDWLRLVPVDFEAGGSLVGAAGRRRLRSRPAGGRRLHRRHACTSPRTPPRPPCARSPRLAPGSTLAMTFLLPPELLDDADRPGLEAAERGARAAGTPFISFYTPAEMLALAREAGFADARHVSAAC